MIIEFNYKQNIPFNSNSGNQNLNQVQVNNQYGNYTTLQNNITPVENSFANQQLVNNTNLSFNGSSQQGKIAFFVSKYKLYQFKLLKLNKIRIFKCLFKLSVISFFFYFLGLI